MITQLNIKNFTAFPKADLQFGRHLNVIIGENGTGKSHLLKLAYSILACLARGEKESGSQTPTKAHFEIALANKLRNVFKPDDLGHLVRHHTSKTGAEVECHFADGSLNTRFTMRPGTESTPEITRCPSAWLPHSQSSAFFPTHELLSISPGFVSLYETTHLQFPETWRDTCLLLGGPLVKGPREELAKEMLAPLEKALGGTVETDSAGRFYLHTKSRKLEMHLVAEGLRKLAMLAQLIANGTFLGDGHLFWDEPESNLNPKIAKLIARTILHMSKQNLQVFIATHSLFLMRELHILQQQEFSALDTRCFGLHLTPAGVSVQQGKTMDDIGQIAALDEDLQQSARYIDTEEAQSAQ